MAFAAARKLKDYNSDETVKITRVGIQNTYQRLYSPMNIFIVSMVQQTSKMCEFRVLGVQRKVTTHF